MNTARALPGVADLEQLHRRYATARDPVAGDVLLQRYLPLALSIANRFGCRAADREDVRQVAGIALFRALERFDPSRGVQFSTFAWATITNELKRWQRDHTWAAHVPRRDQSLYLDMQRAVEDLQNLTGRSPTIAELAEALDAGEEDVLRALEVGQARETASIDERLRGKEWSGIAEEAAYERVDARTDIDGLLGSVDRRTECILRMRFFLDLTQAEIAARLGLSQMHVSRLLRQGLAALREMVATQQAPQGHEGELG